MHAASSETRDLAGCPQSRHHGTVSASDPTVQIGLYAAEGLAGDDVQPYRDERTGAFVEDLVREGGAGELLPVSSLDDVVASVLAVVPVADQWFRVNAEFTAHALRTPSPKRVLVAREKAILATLMPLLDGVLAQIGLEVTDQAALGPSLTAAHDGTLVQCLIEDDVSAALARRTVMFTVLVERYTQESGGAGQAVSRS